MSPSPEDRTGRIVFTVIVGLVLAAVFVGSNRDAEPVQRARQLTLDTRTKEEKAAPREEHPDHRSEIDRHVIIPCLTESARRTGLTKRMEESEAVNLLRATPLVSKSIASVTRRVLPLVSGLDRDSRMKVYQETLKVCIQNTR